MTIDLTTIAPEDLSRLSDEEFHALTARVLSITAQDRKENQLLYYEPASADCRRVHLSMAHYIGVGGGNGSSKTETCLVEIIACATGVIPMSCPEIREKFRGPVNCRVVVESLTTTLENVILPKLMWWRWTGISEQGGEKGHWGWVPKLCLKDADWDTSWAAKVRTLTLLCRDPDDFNRVLGESTVQFMCLRGDQRVLMADGTWRPIAEIEAGNMVRHPDGTAVAVTKTYRYDDAPLIKIRCRGGKEIVSTPNHRHFMADGVLKEVADIRLGDALEVYEPPQPEFPIHEATWADWELGWAALMIGDGYIKGAQACLSAKPPSRVLSDLPPLPPECKLYDVGRGDEWRVTLKSKRRDNPLVGLLKRVGLWGLGSGDKYIPEEVFLQPQHKRAYFLKHLWNTDGCVQPRYRSAHYVSTSRRLAYDVKYLLWGLGIIAAITEGTYPCGFTGKMIKRYTVQIYGGFFDRFVAAVTESEFRHVETLPRGQKGKVFAIEDAGHEAVYCITVDHPSHAFIADGIVTHNSHEQDPTDFASGDFHFILHDEPTTYAIWTENQARTMRANGRLYLAMTWPDDPAIAVDWIFDELYEPGSPGPLKKETHEWIELDTRKNRNLNQESVLRQAENWSGAIRATRLGGKPIRFSNRIHPLFTDRDEWWSFEAGKVVDPDTDEHGDPVCPETGSTDVVMFNHVREIDPSRIYPVVFLLDPHPRKPHMFMWVEVEPGDDYNVILEGEVNGTPDEVMDYVREIEDAYGLYVMRRLVDPNMGASPANSRDRDQTWQMEFADAGLFCDLASDSDVGRGRINEYLQPDPYTRRPRLHVAERCVTTIYQVKRYCWDDHKRALERDLKQLPKRKYDDFPTLMKYLMNDLPTFQALKEGPKGIQYARR